MAKYWIPKETEVRIRVTTGQWLTTLTTSDIVFDTMAPNTSMSPTSMEVITYLDTPKTIIDPKDNSKCEITAWAIGDFVLANCRYLGD